MVNFLIYETGTGRVVSKRGMAEGTVPDVSEGQAFIASDMWPDDVYVKDDEVRVYPPRPEGVRRFDFVEEQWFDPRSESEIIADLAQAKVNAKVQITAIRGQARLVYITDLPGQDMLYTAKYEEAGRYVTDPAPVQQDYPLILSEVGVTAETPLEVAQIFLNLNALWRQAAGAIDAACFGTEAAVDAAQDQAEIDAALAALVAALAGAMS